MAAQATSLWLIALLLAPRSLGDLTDAERKPPRPPRPVAERSFVSSTFG
jgi:hypothetical protein